MIVVLKSFNILYFQIAGIKINYSLGLQEAFKMRTSTVLRYIRPALQVRYLGVLYTLNFLLVLAARWLITEQPEGCQPLERFCDWSTSGKHKQKIARVEGSLLIIDAYMNCKDSVHSTIDTRWQDINNSYMQTYNARVIFALETNISSNSSCSARIFKSWNS